MNYRCLLAISTLCIVLSGCATDMKSDSIADVIRLRGNLDGKDVVVHGYVEVDALGVPWFIPEKQKPKGDVLINSLDIMTDDKSVERRLNVLNNACVIIEGKFEMYKPDNILFGNLASKYGSIGIRNIRSCGGGLE